MRIFQRTSQASLRKGKTTRIVFHIFSTCRNVLERTRSIFMNVDGTSRCLRHQLPWYLPT